MCYIKQSCYDYGNIVSKSCFRSKITSTHKLSVIWTWVQIAQAYIDFRQLPFYPYHKLPRKLLTYAPSHVAVWFLWQVKKVERILLKGHCRIWHFLSWMSEWMIEWMNYSLLHITFTMTTQQKCKYNSIS